MEEGRWFSLPSDSKPRASRNTNAGCVDGVCAIQAASTTTAYLSKREMNAFMKDVCSNSFTHSCESNAAFSIPYIIQFAMGSISPSCSLIASCLQIYVALETVLISKHPIYLTSRSPKMQSPASLNLRKVRLSSGLDLPSHWLTAGYVSVYLSSG